MRRWVGLAVMLASCRSAPPGEPAAAPAQPAPAAEAKAEAPLAAPPADDAPPRPSLSLLVAGDAGVQLLELDGTPLRTLSKTPAVAPRWLPDGKALVFIDQRGTLRGLDLEGNEHSVAPLPRDLPCPAKAYSEFEIPEGPLGLSMDEEFWVSADGRHACIALSDAFPNMRLAQRDVAVALADGRIQQQVVFGGSTCGVPEIFEPLQGCKPRPWPEEPEIESPIPGGFVHSVSPDDAWLLVLVGSELGDVLHNQYVLVRKDDGAVFPTPYGAGGWPTAIGVPADAGEDRLVLGLPDVQGGETVAWVGPHHVVLDRMLYVAGERIVELPGELAPPP